MSEVWVSDAARAEIMAIYDLRLAALGDAVESRMLETSFGSTHVLLAGEPDAPALVVAHGGNGDATQMAAPYGFLAARHRCVFVDSPGDPGRSRGRRIPRGDDSLARWMAELLDSLGIARASLLGMSAGGYVVLRAALGLRERIDRVVGIVPEGFCAAGEFPLPSPEDPGPFVAAITAPDSGFMPAVEEKFTALMAKTLRAVREPMILAPLFSAADFEGFEVPVMVVGGGEDVIFDGRELIARARAIVPSLVEAVLIPEANHIHMRLFRGPEIDRVAAFLAG